jgi:hypothetical protein
VNPKVRLSTLWLFASLNYLYCDIVALMNPSLLKGFLAGHVAGMDVTQTFLFFSAVLVEIPMAMVLLSRLLPRRSNRIANVAAGAIMTVVQLGSNFVGVPAPYYVFFSVAEIAATLAVLWYAWNWREDAPEAARRAA